MKKLVFLFFIVLAQSYFSQSNIQFETTKFQDILNKAKAENKLVFLDAYASWCGPCKLMEKNVFTNKEVADYYNANFINARIDMEKGEGRELAAKYRIMSYPTLMFLNSDGDIVGKEIGYLDEQQFLELGKKNNNPKLVNANLKEEYLKGKLDQPTLLTFINLSSTKDPYLAKQASETYFKNKKEKTFTPEEINVLLTYTQSVDDPNYKVFVENKAAIIEFMPEKNYNQFDNYLKLTKIISNATDEKSGKINRDNIYTEAQTLLENNKELEKSLVIYLLNYYSTNQNYEDYEKVAMDFYGKPDNFHTTEVFAAASIFNDHVKNPASLKKAAEWIEKVLMYSENFDYSNLLAQLYDKIGKKEEAKMFAEMAVNFAKLENRDASEALQILNKK